MTTQPKPKRTLAFRLEPPLALRLQAAAMDRHSTVSDLVREVITEWLGSSSEQAQGLR